EISILRNRIHTQTYGIYLNNCAGGDDLENGPGLIANNFVIATNYGFYLSNTSYQNYYNNSVNITTSGNSGTIGFYLYNGSSNNVVNNNFVHSGWGMAAQIYTASAVDMLDYNNYFSNGNYLAAWGTTNYYDLASFTAASTKDEHSISVYPHYTSSTDLHTMTPWLNAKGTPLAEVTEDMDGEVRDSSTPDIGADEFTPDAGNTTPLAGHYTIGGTSPDYATFADAVADLLIKGVSDSVFMDIRNGNYQIHQVLYTFPGTSMDMPVTFQSESGNHENVTLYYYASGTSDNYVLYLHGADYVHFKDLGFSGNTGSEAYSLNLQLSGGVNGFTLMDCSLTGSTSGSSYSTLLDGQNALSMYKLIQGNLFNNGSYGIYISGVNNSTAQNQNTMILNNEFNNQNQYFLYITYENSIEITDNVVSAPTGNGAYLNQCYDEISILRNRIHTQTYGIYLNNCAGGDDLENGPGLIANNFVRW
ncbi:MAG: right-handed parallel beta-helix repeat-containing protein, partial [Calditrichaceae bacterium]